MSKRKKPIPTNKQAVDKLTREVPTNSVRFYTAAEFPAGFPHKPAPGKVTHIGVATSGSAAEGIEWLVVCPYRVDTTNCGNAGAHFDLDPAIVLLDSDTRDPSPSGLVTFHQKFKGRVTPIEGDYDWQDYDKTVAELKADFTNTGLAPLKDAPEPLRNALQHMVDIIRKDPNWPRPERHSDG